MLSPSQEVEPILAVSRKHVSELHAAASAQRIAVLVEVLGDGSESGLSAAATAAAGEHAGHLRNRLTDRFLRDPAGRRQVLLHEGGRDAEGTGDIVESLDLDFGGQDLSSGSTSTPTRFFTVVANSTRLRRWIGTWPTCALFAAWSRRRSRGLEIAHEGIDLGLGSAASARRAA